VAAIVIPVQATVDGPATACLNTSHSGSPPDQSPAQHITHTHNEQDCVASIFCVFCLSTGMTFLMNEIL